MISVFVLQLPLSSQTFEGRINASITQGELRTPLLYTAGTNFLRVEMTDSNLPNPVDILERNSGALTLLFPHNRSFVRLKSGAGVPPASSRPAEMGQVGNPSRLPAPPSGIGPQPFGKPDGSTSPTRLPPDPHPLNATPGVPAMAMMPPPMMEKMELKFTGDKTNLLGFACEKFEIKQRGETMEIWATDQLLPFQNYVRNQTPRFGPRMIEERWAELLTAKKLFPLRAGLRFENGTEHYRFEVQSVAPQRLKEEDAKLFQPPEGYFEIEALSF
ncbi:MAG TPA: DUF4412 domain-containing protein [Candidatus Acidoferrum sp.]|nr:DUF4412 domain-containing protein [Candidatus Acidoferrum sp.]